jgi:hypothetical protein
MKLTQQKLPPYKVFEVLANKHAVKLDNPPHIGIHPIISIQHVERSVNPADDPFQRSSFEEPEAVDIPGDRWEGEIVDQRTSRSGQKSYLIHCIGWSEKFDEWLRPGRIDQGMIDDWNANRRKRNTQLAMTFLADTPFSKEKQYETVIPTNGPIERPVLYISRATKDYEQGYQATELEITCLHWAFAKLHHYLEGSEVIIVSDHELINGILNSSAGTMYSGRLDKVRMALMPYLDNIKIVYKPGVKMQNVDPISRAQVPSDRNAAEGPRGKQTGCRWLTRRSVRKEVRKRPACREMRVGPGCRVVMEWLVSQDATEWPASQGVTNRPACREIMVWPASGDRRQIESAGF